MLVALGYFGKEPCDAFQARDEGRGGGYVEDFGGGDGAVGGGEGGMYEGPFGERCVWGLGVSRAVKGVGLERGETYWVGVWAFFGEAWVF